MEKTARAIKKDTGPVNSYNVGFRSDIHTTCALAVRLAVHLDIIETDKSEPFAPN